jgi:hypothetical protein
MRRLETISLVPLIGASRPVASLRKRAAEARAAHRLTFAAVSRPSISTPIISAHFYPITDDAEEGCCPIVLVLAHLLALPYLIPQSTERRA